MDKINSEMNGVMNRAMSNTERTKPSVTVILTCFNRAEFTIKCIKKLAAGTKTNISFIVVDDCSTDGTVDKLNELIGNGYEIHIIIGTGSLYWAGGMRAGMKYALENTNTDYYMLVNDDVEFEDEVIDNMTEYYESLTQSEKFSENVRLALVGATKDINKNLSYGGKIHYGMGIKFRTVGPDYNGNVDTFNMNCVLLSKYCFMNTPMFDREYIHSLADFDYGLNISKKGGIIRMYNRYVGVCSDNDVAGGWRDTSLSRRERLRLKEQPKGAPAGPWYHFLKKNFGLFRALVYTVTPYIRIVLGC